MARSYAKEVPPTLRMTSPVRPISGALSGLGPHSTVCRSTNYAFIKGPSDLAECRVDDPETQTKILTWLEKERSKGHKLVGAFSTSLSWLFEVTPNSVRFILEDE